jgi:hypothetical protein
VTWDELFEWLRTTGMTPEQIKSVVEKQVQALAVPVVEEKQPWGLQLAWGF